MDKFFTLSRLLWLSALRASLWITATVGGSASLGESAGIIPFNTIFWGRDVGNVFLAVVHCTGAPADRHEQPVHRTVGLWPGQVARTRGV